jgi:uncharacterized protein YdeI (YjbR/CyaY-like superfamily)
MNPQVDEYLEIGCGRCALVGTPECKVHRWHRELAVLRRIVLDCGLTEERKWGVPCYTFQGANVLILAAFKGYAFLSFFKGVLLSNAGGLLEKPGPNAQSGRQIRFTDVSGILAREEQVRACIDEAIEVERAGWKVDVKARDPMAYPAELSEAFAANPEFEAAFLGLTEGRRRGYLLHFTAPKQSATRVARIERNMERILAGKGMQDR